jgi:hypothetical protein
MGRLGAIPFVRENMLISSTPIIAANTPMISRPFIVHLPFAIQCVDGYGLPDPVDHEPSGAIRERREIVSVPGEKKTSYPDDPGGRSTPHALFRLSSQPFIYLNIPGR